MVGSDVTADPTSISCSRDLHAHVFLTERLYYFHRMSLIELASDAGGELREVPVEQLIELLSGDEDARSGIHVITFLTQLRGHHHIPAILEVKAALVFVGGGVTIKDDGGSHGRRALVRTTATAR